jgi:signal transduction histidine kinase
MSVRLRLTLTLSTLLACTAILGATALFGLSSLSHHYRDAERHYQDLRALYEIGFRAASIRSLLNSPSPDASEIAQHLRLASAAADSISPRPALAEVRVSLRNRLDNLSAPALSAEANRWLADIASLVARTQSDIVATRAAATAQFRRATILLSIVFTLTSLIALGAGLSLYRAIMRPLRALDSAANHLASTDFSAAPPPLPERGDREFRSLIRTFNHASSSLHTLHSSMREQIDSKSRALLRSEQLAAVGTLAAGLAHEINNPLAIIAGYAQTTLRQLPPLPRSSGGGARGSARAEGVVTPESAATSPISPDAIRDTLTIITEETFRCRNIVRDLLSLSHPPSPTADAPTTSLAPIAQRAIDLVAHLPLAKDRPLSLSAPPEPALVRIRPDHLLQVLINILTNALEASPPGAPVTLSLTTDHGLATLAITDRGRGMDDHTLAHAFEPFHTDKPKRGLTGTGLGLSVSHALVHQHHGRLLAHSDGPNTGSTFTIELPLACPLPRSSGGGARGSARAEGVRQPVSTTNR